MFKLVVIAGPNRGTSYLISAEGLTVGRQTGNTVVLPSSKISKQHCTISLQGESLVLKDLGSSNGTFVNGILTKLRKINVGDRIAVGEYVLEVTSALPTSKAETPAAAGFGNLMQFPNQMPGQLAPGTLGSSGGTSGGTSSGINLPPKDLKGKIIWYFENQFMPTFYNLNKKYEWKVICLGMFGLFTLGNLLITVYPLLEASQATIVKETGRRAQFMAKQVAERNAPYLAAKAETKTEIGSIETAEGVQVAVLLDLDSRILAPALKMNQYLSSGPESKIAVNARNLFREGKETGFWLETDSSLVVAVEPVKVLSPTMGRNITIAMALVSIDTSQFKPDLGEMGVVYSQTLILTGIMGGLILLIIYYLTLKPFFVLNEDLDKVLKGDIAQLSHDYKIPELNPLWEILNAAVQRIPKGNSSTQDAFGAGPLISVDEYVGPAKLLGNAFKAGLIVFDGDKKIAYINSIFEEMSGIRSEGALGHDMSEVARDQAMGAFTSDVLGRANPGDEGISEDFEISGNPYKIYVTAYGSVGGLPRCYLMMALKPEE